MKGRSTRRRATPRLMRVMQWSVDRARRFRDRRRPELDGDVVLLQMYGEWEHGQRQCRADRLPAEEAESLCAALRAALDVDQVTGGRPALVGTPAAPEAAVGVAGQEGVRLPHGSPSPAQLASPPDDWRRANLITALSALLDARFGDRPARDRLIDPVLRRNHVGTLEELPTPALAAMANQLLAAEQT